MVLVGLCGLRGCGKGVIREELVKAAGFKEIHLDLVDCPANGVPNGTSGKLHFESVAKALTYVTCHAQENFVLSVEDAQVATQLACRPFFMIIVVLAPMQLRLERCQRTDPSLSLDHLALQDDHMLYQRGLVHVMAKARLTISNGDSLDKLKRLMSSTLIIDDRWIRPTWDAYFMEMAELASRRSNCMRRRVGAVIVKDRRVVATGYNGTARGTRNCNEGGCPRCNGDCPTGTGLEHCYCLHAEENALLEAGRARCEEATVYSTTVPCLGCSQKLIQCGIVRIVYTREYSLEYSARDLLAQAKIELVKFAHDFPHYVDAADH